MSNKQLIKTQFPKLLKYNYENELFKLSVIPILQVL